MKINNLGEAIEVVGALGEFLSRFNETLGVLGSLACQPQSAPKTASQSGRPQPVVAAVEKDTMVPTTWGDRVIEILKESGKPMSPSEMLKVYQAKGWPGPADDRQLYKMVLSGAYYLFQKERLTRHEGKYSLPQKTISPGALTPGENKT